MRSPSTTCLLYTFSILFKHKYDIPSLSKKLTYVFTKNPSIFAGEKPHVCAVCNKGFSTSSSLNTHRRIHSGEKPHQCGVCGKRFTASSNLYYHRMTHIKVSARRPVPHWSLGVDKFACIGRTFNVRQKSEKSFQIFQPKYNYCYYYMKFRPAEDIYTA